MHKDTKATKEWVENDNKRYMKQELQTALTAANMLYLTVFHQIAGE